MKDIIDEENIYMIKNIYEINKNDKRIYIYIFFIINYFLHNKNFF